jgi:hypothetical protein
MLRIIFKNIIEKFTKSEPKRPLGRWQLNNDNFLKTDYANLDSCGDKICGKPEFYKLNSTKIKNNS